jgi:hypothetical protein
MSWLGWTRKPQTSDMDQRRDQNHTSNFHTLPPDPLGSRGISGFIDSNDESLGLVSKQMQALQVVRHRDYRGHYRGSYIVTEANIQQIIREIRSTDVSSKALSIHLIVPRFSKPLRDTLLPNLYNEVRESSRLRGISGGVRSLHITLDRDDFWVWGAWNNLRAVPKIIKNTLATFYMMRNLVDLKLDFSSLSYRTNPNPTQVGSDGCKELVLLSWTAPALETVSLELSGNSVDDMGCCFLCEGLKKLKRLRVLYLGLADNALRTSSANALQELTNIETLESLHLDLEANLIDVHGAVYLSHMRKLAGRNLHMLYLICKNNPMGPDAEEILQTSGRKRTDSADLHHIYIEI